MERVGGSNPPSSTTKPSACIWWFLRWFMAGRTTPMNRIASFGAIAQLVAHLHGMERVGGSNPPSSTTKPSACIWWFLRWFMAGRTTPMNRIASFGAIAQLVAHLHGMERVGGSNPPSSTIKAGASCNGLSRFLAYRPTFAQHSPESVAKGTLFRLARHRRER